ncbi:MAG: radical SAM protein [Spirochaetota bacterium]|nr:radical SAM protein [Spirochaetota bacterium]
MKVLLVNPEYPFEESPTPPFGLMSLAAYLLEKGVEVRIEDYIVTPCNREQIQGVIDEYKPEVVGATGVTMNINTSLKVLKIYKELDPNIVTLIGGPHVTFDADNILNNHSFLDYIVRGEGELTTIELLDSLGSSSSLKNKVKGISYCDNESIIHNEPRSFIDDINILPFPARHLAPLSKYRALGFPINMTTSRGCPYECIFCVGRKMMGKKMRMFDVDRVVDEFEILASMGFKQINLVDDLFTSKKSRCMDICNGIIKRGISHKWTAFSRVNTITEELLEKMKEAGCTMLCFGIESGDQNILNTIKKKTTIDQIQNAIDLCEKVGIGPMSSYILGLPGESRETAKKSHDFARNLNLNHGFHILSPFPGTEVRDKHDEYEMTIMTDDWDKYDANQAIAATKYLTCEEINQLGQEMNSFAEERVSEIFDKSKNKKPMTEIEIQFINGVITFSFAHDLIKMRLVESYPGCKNGNDMNTIIDDFIHYIEKHTKFTKEDIRDRLINLFSNNCLKIDGIKGETEIRWV